MKVIDFIKEKGLQALTDELAIKVQDYPDSVVLNYHQIDSPKKNPIVMECRGLILRKPACAEDDWRVLARSFDRFFNLGECPPMEQKKERALLHHPNLLILEKVDGCLHYRTQIHLWNGGANDIGKIVNKRMTPQLVGVDADGNVVPCEVVRHFKNGQKDDWFELLFYVQRAGRHKCRKRIKVTSNHHIFVGPNETIPVSHLKEGDTCFGYSIVPNESVFHLIESSLLGDGSITRNGKSSCRFVVGHKKEHEDYCNHIEKWLGVCGAKTRQIVSGYGSQILQVSSKSYKNLIRVRQKWYVNGKKQLPKDLGWIDDFSVAIWLMDDGQRSHSSKQKDRIIFSTHGFNREDVARLGERLNQMYGVKCVPFDSKGWALRVNVGRDNAIKKLWTAVAPYIVPCMRYKLPNAFREIPFVGYSRGKESIILTESRLISKRKLENNERNFPSGRQGYDIQTTTGNYFANGILVHNSLMSVHHEAGERWNVASRGMAFAEGPTPIGGTFKKVFDRAIGCEVQEKFKGFDINYTYVFELVSPETRVVKPYPADDVYMIAIRSRRAEDNYKELSWNEVKKIASENGFKTPAEYRFNTLDEILKSLKALPELDEGYVCRLDMDGRVMRVKIKNPKYLAIANLRANGAISKKRIAFLVMARDYDEYLSYFPEDVVFFEPYVEAYAEMMRMIQDLKQYLALTDQKQFALKVKDTPVAPVMFQIRKGKDILDAIDCLSENAKLRMLDSFIKVNAGIDNTTEKF
jgi:hypothetical protein